MLISSDGSVGRRATCLGTLARLLRMGLPWFGRCRFISLVTFRNSLEKTRYDIFLLLFFLDFISSARSTR